MHCKLIIVKKNIRCNYWIIRSFVASAHYPVFYGKPFSGFRVQVPGGALSLRPEPSNYLVLRDSPGYTNTVYDDQVVTNSS